jgi:hypothetical protein
MTIRPRGGLPRFARTDRRPDDENVDLQANQFPDELRKAPMNVRRSMGQYFIHVQESSNTTAAGMTRCIPVLG